MDQETGRPSDIMDLLENDLTETDGTQILAEIEEEVDDDNNSGQTEVPAEGVVPAARPRPTTITRDELLQLISQTGFRRIFYSPRGTRGRGEDDDNDEDDDSYHPGSRSRAQARRPHVPFPKIPSEEGRALMASGTFGTNERLESTILPRKKLSRKILERELGSGSFGRQRNINRLAFQDMIPASSADSIIHYDSRCYSGQFSDDGNFFFSCSQDFRVRMYDTSNPYKWRYYKSVS